MLNMITRWTLEHVYQQYFSFSFNLTNKIKGMSIRKFSRELILMLYCGWSKRKPLLDFFCLITTSKYTQFDDNYEMRTVQRSVLTMLYTELRIK